MFPIVELAASSAFFTSFDAVEKELSRLETYEFSDVYWDEYNVIELIKLTTIKITFMDGTSKVYTGVPNIKKHALKMSLGY